ncbi:MULTISPECIES: lyase family protein [Cupriavidus]
MSVPSASPGHAGAAYAVKDVNEAFRGGARVPAFLGQINQASLVMLSERGVIGAQDARAIAQAILALENAAPAARPSGDYLDYERRLAELAGPSASLVHAGRSRQDIASTLSRMNLRADLLDAHGGLGDMRRALLKLAGNHVRTVIPAYTHGVQAQPTTLAHYLLAVVAALGRQQQRLEQAYARINLSPLGAAALAASSFPVDRERLASLLGFGGIVRNTYDANHLASVDSSLELASVLASCAVQISQFAQDLHSQYLTPHPWITMHGGELMGISSLMPQKRNPAALEQLRAQSSLLLCEMQGPFLVAHNVRTGMFDYRAYDPLSSKRFVDLFALFTRIVDSLAVDAQQARREVDADYSTVTEIADVLMQQAGVPFRLGHHFASLLTDFGRERRLRLAEISYEQACALYREQTGAELPIDAVQYNQCVDAEQMILRRRGAGGPQPDEAMRMLDEEHAAAEAAGVWNARARQALAQAGDELLALTRARAG